MDPSNTIWGNTQQWSLTCPLSWARLDGDVDTTTRQCPSGGSSQNTGRRTTGGTSAAPTVFRRPASHTGVRKRPASHMDPSGPDDPDNDMEVDAAARLRIGDTSAGSGTADAAGRAAPRRWTTQTLSRPSGPPLPPLGRRRGPGEPATMQPK